MKRYARQEADMEPTPDKPQIPLTSGRQLVGISFNPDKNELVDKLKSLAGAMIDMIGQVQARDDAHELLRNHAIHEIITAQMWAVKVATWPGLKKKEVE
jgi:hypothetical protein